MEYILCKKINGNEKNGHEKWPYYTNLYNPVTEPSSFLTSSYVVTFKNHQDLTCHKFIFYYYRG